MTIRIPVPGWVKSWRIRAAAVLVAGLAVWMLAGASSCNGTPSATDNEQQAGQNQLQIYENNQPVPTYEYSALRAELIAIEDEQSKGSLNWAVEISNTGTPLFSCPIMGYPIPSTDELTNSGQAEWNYNNGNVAGVTIGQMEQTGVYTGDSLGTYIPCLVSSGKVELVYSEPMVVTYPYPVAIENGKIVQTGADNGQDAVSVNGGKNPSEPTPKGGKTIGTKGSS